MSEETGLTTISPAIPLASFDDDRNKLVLFLQKSLKKDTDYGTIPGTGNKKVLLQPGAEKLAKYFGMRPEFQCLKEIEEWEKGFVYYKYKCTLFHIRTGFIVGDSERSCNSKESKYRTKTVFDVANTVKAMAQKRAIVAAVRTATMAADLFEDDEIETVRTPEGATKQISPLVARLFDIANKCGYDEVALHKIVKAKFGVDSIRDLSNVQLNQAIEGLTEHYAKKMSETVDSIQPIDSEVKKTFVEGAMAEIEKSSDQVKAELKDKINKLRSKK